MTLISNACLLVTLLITGVLAEGVAPVGKVSGHVQPVAQTDVKPEVAGRIKRVHCNIGDRVKAGDVLMEIEDAETFSTKEVRAPSTGIILRLPIISGEFVRPASELHGGTILMTIADFSKVMIEAHLKETDAAKLKLKQTLRITAEAFPEEAIEGAVTFIAPISTVKDSVKGILVQAVIEKPDSRLVPGAAVQVNIPVTKTAR